MDRETEWDELFQDEDAPRWPADWHPLGIAELLRRGLDLTLCNTAGCRGFCHGCGTPTEVGIGPVVVVHRTNTWDVCDSCVRDYEAHGGHIEPLFYEYRAKRFVWLSPERPCVEARLDLLLRFDPALPEGQEQFTPEQIDAWAGLVQEKVTAWLQRQIFQDTPFGKIRGWSCGPTAMTAAALPEPP